MAHQLIIECYEGYLTEVKDINSKMILTEAIELLRETDNPAGFMVELRSRLPNFDRKTISKVIREASDHKDLNIDVFKIADTITG